MGLGLSPEVADAVERAVDLVLETVEELRADAAYAGRRARCTSCRSPARSSTPRFAMPTAGGSPRSNMRVGRLRQVVPDSLVFYFEIVSAGHGLRGRRLEHELVGALHALRRVRTGVGSGAASRGDASAVHSKRCRSCRRSAAPAAKRRGRGRCAADEFEVESIEVETRRRPTAPANRLGGAMHRTKMRVAEDALDANETIARANRDDFDRASVSVVNLMSAPGAGKTSLLERALEGLDGVRAGVLEGDVQGSMDADRIASLHVPVDAAQYRSELRRRMPPGRQHGALGDSSLPLDEIDMLVIENVGNLVCPAEFRVGEDARVMVASVAEGEDKPLKYPLMFRTCELVADQQDGPSAPSRLRPGPLPLQPRCRASRRGANAGQR